MKNQIIRIVRTLDFENKYHVDYANNYCKNTFVVAHDDANYVKNINNINLSSRLVEFHDISEDGFLSGIGILQLPKWRYISLISIEPLIGKVFFEPSPILADFINKPAEFRNRATNSWVKGVYKGLNLNGSGFFSSGAGNFNFMRIIPESPGEPVVESVNEQVIIDKKLNEFLSKQNRTMEEALYLLGILRGQVERLRENNLAEKI